MAMVQLRAMVALQHCVLTSLFGPASDMEENNRDFVGVIERSIRRVDGSLYNHKTVQDAACLMHDVLWVLWGKLKQADWGGGKASMSDSGREHHRMVLMGISRTAPRLNHVSAAHIVESWMFVEMALSIWIAVQHRNQSVCPVDVMTHAHGVYQHLAIWVRGEATTVPAAVSNSLCEITSGGESQWPLGWFFVVLTCKCGYTFNQGVWSCSGIESYTPEEVAVLKSIVSLFCSTARKMQNMDSMQSCSVLEELEELPADLSGVCRVCQRKTVMMKTMAIAIWQEEKVETMAIWQSRDGRQSQSVLAHKAKQPAVRPRRAGSVGGSEAAADCDLLPHEP